MVIAWLGLLLDSDNMVEIDKTDDLDGVVSEETVGFEFLMGVDKVWNSDYLAVAVQTDGCDYKVAWVDEIEMIDCGCYKVVPH